MLLRNGSNRTHNVTMRTAIEDLPTPPAGVKYIPLTQGKFAIVDEDMFAELNRFQWFIHCGYARRNSEYIRGTKRHLIHMSRVVAGVPDGLNCDHRSLNRLDNRRENLRTTPARHELIENNRSQNGCPT